MKPWYTSKTMWFNGLLAAMGAVAAAFPQALLSFPPEYTGYFLLASAAVGAFLRAVTSESVTV